MRIDKEKEKELEALLPNLEMLRAELNRAQKRRHSRGAFWTVLLIVVVLAAAAALSVKLWTPVLEMRDSSMSKFLSKGDIVVALKDPGFSAGDVCAVRYGNKMLARRIIAGPGQEVNLAEDGTVSVDGVPLEEPYVSRFTAGEDSTISFPCTVPDACYFVLCDNRDFTQDSRSSRFGCPDQDDIIGRVVLRIWPLNRFGTLD